MAVGTIAYILFGSGTANAASALPGSSTGGGSSVAPSSGGGGSSSSLGGGGTVSGGGYSGTLGPNTGGTLPGASTTGDAG